MGGSSIFTKSFTYTCILGILFLSSQTTGAGSCSLSRAAIGRYVSRNAVFLSPVLYGSRAGRPQGRQRSTGLQAPSRSASHLAVGRQVQNLTRALIMVDQSPSAPSTLASSSFQELVDNLYAVAVLIDDCKWIANALYRSASSSNISTPHEVNKRMEEVSQNLFTILWEVSNEILRLAQAFEKRGEPKQEAKS